MDFKSEQDVDRLRQVAELQQAQLERQLAQLRLQAIELARLKGVPANQELKLLLDRLEDGSDASSAPRKNERKKPKKRSKTGPTPQPKLERTTELFELDEPDQVCPECGGDLVAMDGQTEDSEMVDVVSVEYVIREVKRQKYSCRCGCMDTALGPARVTPGSRYSLDFGVQVATAKYLDHLPWERQARMMARRGLDVTSQTLWGLSYSLAKFAEPTWRALRQHALSGDIIGLDQTGWPRLDSKSKKKWQMWCITTDHVVFHQICDDKSAATFNEFVGDYAGYIVCDDLSTHGAGARGSPDITLVGCWAHIFRRFKEASDDFPQARTAMRLIRLLYDIDQHSPPEDLAANRAFWSKRVLDALYDWMTTVPVLKTTDLGKAILHTLKNKERLWRIIDDPNVWLDNNPTERGLRGPVVGRRNHFGSKSRRGTYTASIFYSIIETAKLNGINPESYLRAIAVAAQDDDTAVVMPWDIPADA